MTDNSDFTYQFESEFSEMQRLAEGTYCDTYLIRLYGKLHFAKQLKKPYASMPIFRTAFVKEFETGYRLDHPALPKYISLNNQADEPVIIEEYIEGKTLTAFVNDNPGYYKNRRHADAFIDDLLSVIGYLHQHDIIYLDLKPDNIMVSSVGHQLHLVDLGGCWTSTFDNTTAYTPSFSAPEQIQAGYQQNVRTDIFLIGKILQFIKVPPIYNKVVKSCLQERLSCRYSNIEELLSAIRNTRKRGRLKILSVALLLILIGVTVAFFVPWREENGEAVLALKQRTTAGSPKPSKATLPVTYNRQQPQKRKQNKTAETLQGNGHVNGSQKLSSSSDKSVIHPEPSLESDMLADLHRGMDHAFNRHLSVLNASSSFDAETWGAHWQPYTEEVKKVEDIIHEEYPSIPLSEIREQSRQYMSQTVSPVFAKLKVD